jgi:hypothetical protein
MSRTRAATPRIIAELLNRRIVEALKAPEVGPRFDADGKGITRISIAKSLFLCDSCIVLSPSAIERAPL